MTTRSTAFAAAAFDLDATLLEGSVLSEENVAAVELMKQQGITCVLATGRNYHHTLPYYRRLNLNTAAVTNDGALVSIPGGAILSERCLPIEASAEIINQAQELKLTCLSYFRHGVHVSSQFDWGPGMERHKEIGRFFRVSSPKLMSTKPVYKTLVYCDEPRRLDDFQAKITAQFPEELDAIRNHPCVLEFISKGVSKVYGLKKIAQHFGFTAEQFVVFGDGVNDIGMFGWAGMSVCMNHGHEAAKKAAQMVAPKTAPGVNLAEGVKTWLALSTVAKSVA